MDDALVDPHIHLLPGLDDGPPSLAAALDMARQLRGDGVGTVICTPHFAPGYYANGRDRVLQAVARLHSALADASIDLEILPGCEALAHPRLPELLARGELPTLADRGRHVLLELPWTILGPQAPRYEAIIEGLRDQGPAVILAHPERYELVHKNPDWLSAWVERGLLVQVNVEHLLASAQTAVGRTARLLLQRSCVHLLGSDGHDTRRRPANLGTALRQLAARYGDGLIAQATRNARAVAAGLAQPLAPLEPDAPLEPVEPTDPPAGCRRHPAGGRS
ncbi:MAG TPA: CpsB/CapC family capsule biosynthesis tyrosine phosphatase [Bacillota bacterium]